MKIVLLDTRNGMMLAGAGKYTTTLEKAVGFRDTALASEFRNESHLSNHNVALRFCDACLDYAQTQVPVQQLPG